MVQGAVIAAEGLVYRYRPQGPPAVDGLSLAVDAGEIFGLLGPNGAGKTTTISLLSTLLRPAAGSIALFGEDLLRAPQRLRAKIGLVPQEIALYPSLSGRENLAYFGRLHGLKGAKLEQRVEECLELVGLAGHGEKRVSAYSGGMKRRANLAAGIVHRPELLFLDEPTVGIDAQSRGTILRNLERLRAEGMTMVYTTHYMEEARQLCGRLAIVDGGKVIAAGRPTELIAQSEGCTSLEDLFLRLTGRHLRD